MYKLDRPSMAVNDPRVNRGNIARRFQMENTWDITVTERRKHIIGWVAEVGRRSAGGKLKNLVLSCNGLPGVLQLGEGFNIKNSTHIGLFKEWAGLVEKIWLPDCLVARSLDAKMQAKMDLDYPGLGVGDGNTFCSAIAKQARCYVVAATAIQHEYATNVPMDMMTSFEGLVVSYGPEGKVTWSSQNPTTMVPD